MSKSFPKKIIYMIPRDLHDSDESWERSQALVERLKDAPLGRLRLRLSCARYQIAESH